jgi:hypothetical protein
VRDIATMVLPEYPCYTFDSRFAVYVMTEGDEMGSE